MDVTDSLTIVSEQRVNLTFIIITLTSAIDLDRGTFATNSCKMLRKLTVSAGFV